MIREFFRINRIGVLIFDVSDQTSVVHHQESIFWKMNLQNLESDNIIGDHIGELNKLYISYDFFSLDKENFISERIIKYKLI